MADELQDYLKSLNPSDYQQHILVYGSTYKLYREGKYLGEAIWYKDENVGDSFQIRTPCKEGVNCNVIVADQWELVIK